MTGAQEAKLYLDLGMAFVAAAGMGAGWARWVRPRARARASEKRAISAVLLGTPAIPANPITGAKAIPATPSIGAQVAQLQQLTAEIHHELHPNGGGSMKDSQTRLEQAQQDTSAKVDQVMERLAAGDERFERIERENGARFERIEQALQRLIPPIATTD